MMILLNAVTLFLCVGILIVFRKMDKSNIGISKLKRYSDKIFDDFKKLAENEQRKLKDATIEMDVLSKKSNNLTANLSFMMKEIETRLNSLSMEKENLKRVEDDVRVISDAAQDVNRQIEFIGEAKRDFSGVADKILFLQQSLAEIREESGSLLNGFNIKLRERSKELSDEFASMVNEYADDFTERKNQLFELKATAGDLENTVFADIKEKSQQMKDDIKHAVSEFSSIRSGFIGRVEEDIEKVYEKIRNAEISVSASKTNLIEHFQNEVSSARRDIDADIEKVYEKIRNVEINVNSSKTDLIESFQNEVSNARQEIDNISIVTVTKKDEIIKSARDEYQRAAANLEKMSEKIKDDLLSTEQRLNDMKDEIMDYEQKTNIFERADSLTDNVENAVLRLNGLLETARKEYEEIEKFMDDSENFKELRKSVEKEIREYQIRKEKLADVETNIQNLLEKSELAINGMDMIKQNVTKVDYIDARIDAIAIKYSDLDSKIEELREYESLVDKSIEAAGKSENLIKSVDVKIQNFQKSVEGSEKKVERLNGHLQDFESKTYKLKNRMQEIEELNDKLDEVDSMRELMEQHVKQIQSMFKKVSDLRENIDDTDSRLQKMCNKADEKMREFATFIQSVDSDSLISKQVNRDAPAGKNINEHLIKTVRELSDKGWEPDDIAKKMFIDESQVRLIINSAKL
jgi:chromosome segregation ATPase